MIPLIAAGALLVGGFGAGAFTGAQVDDALDNGSGGGFDTSKLILGAALLGTVYIVATKGKLR